MAPADQPFFDAKTFVQPGCETSSGNWSDDDRRAILSLRNLYPELAHWGDLAIGCAFGDYSQDVLDVNWADWMVNTRDEEFIKYCLAKQAELKQNY